MTKLLPDKLRSEIEAAYDHRGHVTIELKDGAKVEGFVYNREYENSKLKEDCFVDVFIKDSDEKRRISAFAIASLALSGKDYAETYEQGLARVKKSSAP